MNSDNTVAEQSTVLPVEQVSLEIYNMLVKHTRNLQRQARCVNLKAMSYEEAKQYHRAKGRIGK